MHSILKLALVIGATASLVFGALIVARRQTREVKRRPIENQLRWYASEAKKAGRRTVEIGGRIIFLGEVRNIEHALERTFTVVVAQVINQHARTLDGNRIDTWHKLQILETLSTPQHQYVDIPGNPPQELLPLNRGEFLLKTAGGTLEVYGVELTERGIKLKRQQKYLLFVALKPDGVAELHVGSNAIFEVDPNDTLIPQSRSDNPHVFKDYVKRHNNSLDAIRASFKVGQRQ